MNGARSQWIVFSRRAAMSGTVRSTLLHVGGAELECSLVLLSSDLKFMQMQLGAMCFGFCHISELGCSGGT